MYFPLPFHLTIQLFKAGWNYWNVSLQTYTQTADAGVSTVSNRNTGRTVETPELRSYNAEFRSFSMDSPPFLVFWLTVGRNYHFLKILGYVHRTWKVAYPDLHELFLLPNLQLKHKLCWNCQTLQKKIGVQFRTMHYESFRTWKFRTFMIFLKALISGEWKCFWNWPCIMNWPLLRFFNPESKERGKIHEI